MTDNKMSKHKVEIIDTHRLICVPMGGRRDAAAGPVLRAACRRLRLPPWREPGYMRLIGLLTLRV